MQDEQSGRFFPPELIKELRKKIRYVDHDPACQRIYFESAGGSLTLGACCDAAAELNAIPDFANRPTPGAAPLQLAQTNGIADSKLTFGAKSGSILADLTVSKAIFTVTGVILENATGTNVVTTELEHPATYDSCLYFGRMFNKEVRSARINSETGAVDVEDLVSKIDKDTALLSIIHASNITGTINDIKTIVREARKINPNIYILLDSTQHIPHGIIDVEQLGVDAAGYAPYKMLGKRGLGIMWVSDRVATMPHPHFLEGMPNDWDLGGYEPAGLYGITLVTDYICDIGKHYSASEDRRTLFEAGMEAIELQERALIYRILHGSSEIPGVNNIPGVNIHFVQDITKRDCILPMTFENIDTETAVKKFIANGIYVYHRSRTNKMSRRILDGIGIPSLVRVAPMHCNTLEEVDRFLTVTAGIATGRL
ncbi:MAG: aminotransferase class V-fold PLP-dependent enzyme [Clostridiales bacterium]|nr:aminotransferase class V-fold PLP-dependent enzyme [Clostridiales bacterium]